MKRIPVQSSNLAAINHDATTQTLVVEFHGGQVYAYHDVPRHIFDALLAASSQGIYLNAVVKSAYKNVTKLPAWPQDETPTETEDKGEQAVSVPTQSDGTPWVDTPETTTPPTLDQLFAQQKFFALTEGASALMTQAADAFTIANVPYWARLCTTLAHVLECAVAGYGEEAMIAALRQLTEG